MFEIENNTCTLIVKKSKFISLIYKINSKEEINDILNDLRKEYKDATHICYAYKFSNNIKYDDDNEPNNTAGFQILKAIETSNVTNILAVVIRYFGGTLLGTGGLSRSYFKVTKDCIKESTLKEIKEEIIIDLETSLDNLKLLNNITKDLNIVNKLFDDKITYSIKINKKDENDFLSSLENTNIKAKRD